MQGERPALLFISAPSPTGLLIDREEMFKLKILGTEDRGRKGILGPTALLQELTALVPAERLPQRPGAGLWGRAGLPRRGQVQARSLPPPGACSISLPPGKHPSRGPGRRGGYPAAPGERGRRLAEARSFPRRGRGSETNIAPLVFSGKEGLFTEIEQNLLEENISIYL